MFLVTCPPLNDPDNGMINCSLGDDGVLSYEDTCSFTCNTGYELTGSDNRTCQSDGSWSGTETMCTAGVLVQSQIVGVVSTLASSKLISVICSYGIPMVSLGGHMITPVASTLTIFVQEYNSDSYFS